MPGVMQTFANTSHPTLEKPTPSKPGTWSQYSSVGAQKAVAPGPPSAAGTMAAKGGMRLPPMTGSQVGATSPHPRTRPKEGSANASETMLSPNT
ncbi:hypothetical protein GCM10010272_54620 [Streptomyces lateritius]|nr:hypothetical protein GCM10010272_54620 [Streptomyces lateritius]